MLGYFKPLRRAIGIATLVIACLFAGGCYPNSSSEYRAIDQVSADSTDPVETTMKSAPETLAQLDPDPVSALDFANKPKIELLVPNKTFRTDRNTNALQLTFDDINLLTILNMEPVTDDAVSLMPEWLTSLGGKRVRVRGFMFPTFVQEGLEVFVLLRDNQQCCYGPGAKIYDHIFIKMKQGTTTNYVPIQRSLDVVGRFKIDLQSARGSVFGLYVIEDASVIVR